MRDLETMIGLGRAKMASNPRNGSYAAQIAAWQQEFDSISTSLGGDRPGVQGTAATPQPSYKDAIYDQMRAIDAQISEVKRLAAEGVTPGIEQQLSGLMEQYDQLSASMGGDRVVQLDQAERPHIVPSTPAGCSATTTTFTQNTPTAIPTGPAVVTSTVMVSGAGTYVWDIDLVTNLTHTFAADLDITIQSPAGTIVTLTTDNGAGNDDVFNGTLWDDDANPAGQVPYTTNDGTVTDHAYVNLTLASPLVPEEAFAAFIGEDPNGTWTITISDDLAGDGGSLNSWSLGVTTIPAPTLAAPATFTQNTPTAIPTGPAVVSSTVMVSGLGATLADVNVTTNLTHTFAADLDITIQSPAGTIVTLTTDNGAGNDDVFNGTVWDDSANPGGQVPYTTNDGLATDHAYVNLTLASPLVPEEALGAFIGEDPNGTWTITISDDLAGDGGSLNSWSLDIVTATCGGGGGIGPCVSSSMTFSNNTPTAIPTGPAVVSSTLMVSGVDTYLSDLNVTTFLTHTFAADLDITIQSPAGTVVTLTTDNGAGNDDVFNGTVWDDSANPGGQVPYTTNNGLATDHAYVNLTLASPLVPEEALGAFIGEDPNGTWTITISDDLAGDGGSLNSWSLDVATFPSAPNETVTMATNNTPLAIPTGPAVVSSSLMFTGPTDAINKVRLTTNLTHTFAADLDITLMSPTGTVVTLTTDNGAGNDDVFNGTVWDDAANPAGQVPYTTNNGLATDHAYVNLTLASPLVPEEALAAFNGEDANGMWTITISDDLAGDGGSLDSWTLEVTTVTCGVACDLTITCPADIVATGTTVDPAGCGFTSVVTYTDPVSSCLTATVACVPASGSTFAEGVTTVTCTASDGIGGMSTCSFTVTVGSNFDFCAVDDATGDTFSIVTATTPAPCAGFWRYHIVATNTTICGNANFVNHIPGVKLRAYDNNYSPENPLYFMDATFGPTSGTVVVKRKNGTILATLRDRNINNNPPCNGAMAP